MDPIAPDHAPAGRSQRRLASAVALCLGGFGLACTPFAQMPLAAVPGYMTAFGMAMLIVNMLLAALLLTRGAAEGGSAGTRLGTAYWFVAIIFMPLMAAFPNAIMPGNLIGDTHSPVWLWVFWHGGFGLAVLRYAVSVTWLGGGGPVRVWRGGGGGGVLVAGCTWLATRGLDLLPSVLPNGHTFFTGNARLIPLSIIAVNVLALVAMARVREPTTEQLWLQVAMVAACVDVWLTHYGANRFSLGWYTAKLASLTTSMVVLLSMFHEVTRLYRQAWATNRLLQQLASQDGLTLLTNRRQFDIALEQEWRRAKRVGDSMSLLLIDVDFFKRFNDRYGHLAGDQCLRDVAAVLRECCKRPADTAARYGGEEFVLLLASTGGGGALEVGTRVQEALARREIAHLDGVGGLVTVSIGLATASAQSLDDPRQLVEAADQALYRAKAQGRNRVIVAQHPGLVPDHRDVLATA